MIEKYDKWLSDNGIALSQEEKEKLDRFAFLVFRWNKKINLTAAKSLEEIIKRHILDSLMPLTLNIKKEKNIIDLGSGGGFPAIPLAVVLPETKFHLVEKVAKKCAFLNKAARELKLENITVINEVFDKIPENISPSLITRAVKIDKKILARMKEKGIKTYYTFETSFPSETAKGYRAYLLPEETKKRFITERGLNE